MIGTTRDGADLVKVVDFGIAKAVDSTAQKVTKTGAVIGTPEYMSPEQLAGDPVDGRSDIYSLGLVAFSMLTGTSPFPSDSAQESMIMRLTERPKTLSETRPEARWPSGVQVVLDRALQRDAALRYQKPLEFARALVLAVNDDPEDVAVPATRIGTGSVPATRIAPRAASAFLGNEANDVAPMLSSEKRRTVVTSVVGGIAVLLAISAVLYAPILQRNKKPPVIAADSPGTPSPSQPRPESSTSRADSSRQTGPTLPAIDLDRELSTAEREARGDDTAAARAAINRVVAVESSLVSTADATRAAFVKFNAYLTLDDRAKACAALASIKGRVRGTSYQSKVDDRLETCP
jgi:serine/threonine-protein kinase